RNPLAISNVQQPAVNSNQFVPFALLIVNLAQATQSRGLKIAVLPISCQTQAPLVRVYGLPVLAQIKKHFAECVQKLCLATDLSKLFEYPKTSQISRKCILPTPLASKNLADID